MRYLIITCLLFLLVLIILNMVPLLASRPCIYDRQENVPTADFGLVLGAGLTPDGEPSPILRDRLETALKLYRAKKIKKLVLSGDGTGPWYNEVQAMKKYLLTRGVNTQDLLLDPKGINTLASLLYAKEIGSHSFIIFSQKFHLPRAIFLARALKIDAVGFVSDQHISPTAYRFWYQWREIWARPKAIVVDLWTMDDSELRDSSSR